MLAISQIEVSVKAFWGNIYSTFPKPEFHNLAMTHGESEVRHGELYSRLLALLGFEKEFKEFLNNQTARDRFNWLTKPRNSTPTDVVYNIAIFAMLMENVSLFSQFLIMLSYRRHLGVMKNIANGVGWTVQDETAHYETGAWLVQQMRSEYPEIDASGFVDRMKEVAFQALEHEIKMIDYILDGEKLTFLSRESIIEFVKDRLNRSLQGLRIEPVYECDPNLLEETKWFYLLTTGTSHKDFFDVRPVEYGVKDVVFSHDQLF
jgi:ribonucleoside-diphosphate reductase beta chain